MVYQINLNRRPDLFLSHSSEDKKTINKLAKDLQVCEVDVWFDKWEIGIGDSLFLKINEGLTISRYIAVFLSNSFLSKKWTSAEVQAAFARQIDEGKVIIPIMLEPVDVPVLLKDRLYASLSGDYYSTLTRLAGLTHEIQIQQLENAIDKFKPDTLAKVINTLKYCGKDVHMIVPKDIFDEIVSTGLVKVDDTRLSFESRNILPVSEKVSQRARDYILRLNGKIKQVQ